MCLVCAGPWPDTLLGRIWGPASPPQAPPQGCHKHALSCHRCCLLSPAQGTWQALSRLATLEEGCLPLGSACPGPPQPPQSLLGLPTIPAGHSGNRNDGAQAQQSSLRWVSGMPVGRGTETRPPIDSLWTSICAMLALSQAPSWLSVKPHSCERQVSFCPR